MFWTIWLASLHIVAPPPPAAQPRWILKMTALISLGCYMDLSKFHSGAFLFQPIFLNWRNAIYQNWYMYLSNCKMDWSELLQGFAKLDTCPLSKQNQAKVWPTFWLKTRRKFKIHNNWLMWWFLVKCCEYIWLALLSDRGRQKLKKVEGSVGSHSQEKEEEGHGAHSDVVTALLKVHQEDKDDEYRRVRWRWQR